MTYGIVSTSILLGITLSRTVWWRQNVDLRCYNAIARWRTKVRHGR